MTTKKKEEKKVDWRIICTGLVCIAGLEAFAITQGFNGTILKIVLVTLALAIGVTLPSPVIKK